MRAVTVALRLDWRSAWSVLHGAPDARQQGVDAIGRPTAHVWGSEPLGVWTQSATRACARALSVRHVAGARVPTWFCFGLALFNQNFLQNFEPKCVMTFIPNFYTSLPSTTVTKARRWFSPRVFCIKCLPTLNLSQCL
jgi:hypothetical protein